MRNSIRFAAAALAVVSFGSVANAATTATGTATAEVLSTLTVTPTTDLRFGQIAANTGGTIVIPADSASAITTTGTLVSTGTRGEAAFTVAGNKGVGVNLASLSVTTPLTYQGAWNVGTQGPVPTMGLSALTSHWNNNVSVLDATTGQAVFTVGGTLTVASAQEPGVYSGTFSVSVEYR
jgi:Domain of unknown function (DUF4402)